MVFRTAFVALLFAAILVACGDRYRYPCQDPANAGSPACVGVIMSPPTTCPTPSTLRTKNKALGVTGSTIYGPVVPC